MTPEYTQIAPDQIQSATTGKVYRFRSRSVRSRADAVARLMIDDRPILAARIAHGDSTHPTR